MNRRSVPALQRFAIAAVIAAAAVGAHAQTIDLEPPGERDFILDRAGMIRPEDAESIRAICDTLLTDQAIPIIVVTIESMARYGGQGMSIETFAYELFNQWGIGHESVNDVAWNRGVLLLVSRDDRKARIELGADWGRHWDGHCQHIMDTQIIPQFKAGDFGEGTVRGVAALSQMAALGPLADPPGSEASPFFGTVWKIVKFMHSPFPKAMVKFFLILSVVFIILGLALPQSRKQMFIIAITFIGISIFLWITLLIFLIIAILKSESGSWWRVYKDDEDQMTEEQRKVRRIHRLGGDWGGYGGGGGFSGGGGFGGGCSGGGGASGGW